ncbi:hypothetical protein DJ031_01985 [bacterium endosymbiont of Escarpia laminata]|nr:MAG: hypothetical protein DJ031_01985 [bacterium endosymbiont of Escarpia laminata]
MFRSICLTLLLIGLSGCVSQQTRPASQSTLDQWVEQDLIPYLKTQLSQHPRFQGESILLGRLNDGAIQPKMDQLTRDIRDKINAELLATPGIHLARQQRDKHWSHRDRPTKPCDGEQPIHYFIGLDLRLDSSRQLNLTLRALDLQQNSWVSGFSRQWQGEASRQQEELLHTVHLDESLRGLRMLPFVQGQPDLMARQLADDLYCRLKQLPVQNPKLHIQPYESDEAQARTTMELLTHYLARFGDVHIENNQADADLTIKGKTHRISGNLQQFWILVRPAEAASALPDISVSTYLLSDPEQATTTGVVPAQKERPVRVAKSAGVLQIITPRKLSLCGTRHPWRSGERVLNGQAVIPKQGCFALEIAAPAESRGFFFKKRGDGALFRLAPSECRHLGVRSSRNSNGKTLRLPSRHRRGVEGVLHSDDQSERETYYAIITNDDRSAGVVAAHLALLPESCHGYEDPQLNAEELMGWLQKLDQLMLEHASNVAWTSRDITLTNTRKSLINIY